MKLYHFNKAIILLNSILCIITSLKNMELRLLTRLFPAEKTFFANEVCVRNDSIWIFLKRVVAGFLKWSIQLDWTHVGTTSLAMLGHYLWTKDYWVQQEWKTTYHTHKVSTRKINLTNVLHSSFKSCKKVFLSLFLQHAHFFWQTGYQHLEKNSWVMLLARWPAELCACYVHMRVCKICVCF